MIVYLLTFPAGSDSQDDTSITLALSTLGSFDFEGKQNSFLLFKAITENNFF